MALPKNSIYCPACHRTKLLFETEAKANNFIKFNRDEILRTNWRNHKVPVRSYYCQLCGGFHVTSNPSAEDGKRIDEHINERIEIAKKFEQDSTRRCNTTNANWGAEKDAFHRKADGVRSLILLGQIAKAEQELRECEENMESLRAAGCCVDSLNFKMEKMHNLLSTASKIAGMTEEEQADYLTQNWGAYNIETIACITGNYRHIRQIESLLEQNEELLAKGMHEQVRSNIKQCRLAINGLRYVEKKHTQRMFSQRLSKQSVQARKPKKKAKTYEDKYRATLLTVINKIESIENDFGKGNYYACGVAIAECNEALKKLKFTDANIELVRQHLNSWKKQLAGRASGAECA